MTTECEPGEHCLRPEKDSDHTGEWTVWVCQIPGCGVETETPRDYDKPEEE